ncbi:MAG: type III pantothenate kinase [Phycisphaerae bacterium]|nr:type III pantothenate kinase [Phycisphaerae bacterium]
MTNDNESQIPGVLACDCGNTCISFTQVQGEAVSPVQRFRPGEWKSLGKALEDAWADMPSPKKIVAASVNAAALRALEAAATEILRQDVLVVGRDLPLPMSTTLANPEKIGVDRLCCAAAAFDRLGVACVVADFGTAITIDCVDGRGVFLGGAILPGLRTSAAALHAATDQLPEVELTEPTWVFGGDTRQAIVGGVVYGARGALRERVEAYATELGAWPIVIVTGGDAHLICPHPGEEGLVQAVVEDLCLRGVAIAYYKTLLRSE